ncbi:MAG: Pepco domain-containing protein [Elainellaceae cyanobacterium]
MADQYIWIVTDAVPTGDRGGDTPRSPFEDDVPTIPSGKRPGIPVPVEKLEQGMADFLDTMGRVLKQAQAKAQDIGGMELDEIELSVEVNGEGQLSLLGSGTKVGGKGALTLKFKRAAAAKPGE